LAAQAGASPQKVWDAPTRLFHWLLAGLFAFSWWTGEEGRLDWHRWSGYLIAGLIVFRIYWGFAGPETARFARFVRGPRQTLAYAFSLFRPDYRLAFGHNPLGALSVLAILLALIAQVGLGLFAQDTDTGLVSGPLNRFVSYETAEAATELHEAAFDILMILIAVHVAAVAFYLVVKRANLVGPMITGRRRRWETGPEGGLTAAPLWRLGLGVLLAAATIWLLATI
jgi:cytochrome b